MIADLKALPVHPGGNHFPKFTPDGHGALVTRAWRDNGNAHGFSVFTVMAKGAPEGYPDVGWTVVPIFEPDGAERLAVTDAPFDDEAIITSVRFAKGKVDGKRATLLVIAQRHCEESIPTPASTDILIYRLTIRPNDDPIGRPAYYFEHIETRHTARKYCNAETALAVELGFPMPTEWPGNQFPDGCIPDASKHP